MTPPDITYLDYMASTPIEPSVVKKMLPYLEGNFGNAASKNHYGYVAREAIAKARKQVALTIGADDNEIIFTSGATEATNLALKGAAKFYRKSGNHIITLKTEHSATIETCEHLKQEGFEVTYLAPENDGLLDLDKLKKALTPSTIIVSICHVNNEIGVIQDIAAIGEIVANNGAVFHVDAAQSVGKVDINTKDLNVGLISLSAHKCYGPKGIGALYLRQSPRLHISPQNHGGGHENNIRSGTLPTHQIVGMGYAYELAKKNFAKNLEHVKYLEQRLLKGLLELPDTQVNGCLQNRVPHNINITFGKISGEILYNCLQQKLAISSGSACNNHKIKVSHVLTAIGLNSDEANATIRYSYGHTTTVAEIDTAIAITQEIVTKLRNNI